MKRAAFVTAIVAALAMSSLVTAFADDGGSITSPAEGEYVLSDTLELRATTDLDSSEEIAWAVRSGVDNADCGTSQTDLAGWRSDNEITWEEGEFAADIDISNWEDGYYCFVVNPKIDGEFYTEYRDFHFFYLANSTSKAVCKDGGWMTVDFGDYKNQGQCVSDIAKNK